MKLKKLLPILILVMLLGLFFYFRLYEYLSFSSLQKHHALLTGWAHNHFLMTSIGFMLCYALAVAISIPGATFFTLAGGLLFGTVVGSIYIIVSATFGAAMVFLAVQHAFAFSLARRAGPFAKKLEAGFQENAFSYLIVLRLVPIFPFWLINIIPALLGMRFKSYVLATLIGVMPGTIIYTSIGSGFSSILKAGEKPDLGIFLEPQIILPLVGLAVLAMLPVAYKHFQKRRRER